MTSENTVEAVEKAVRVLGALYELDGAGVTELATHLDMSKPTVYMHLSTLEQCEFVVKEGTQYRVGLRFLEFGEYARRQTEVYHVMQEEVDLLAEETGEMAQIVTEEHGWGVYLYKAGSSRAIRTNSRAGSRRLLHCTALGKAILAHYSRDHVEDIVDRHGLPERTANTITDPETLFATLEDVRERGYAYDDEEIQPGLRCVAAPIRDYDGGVLGAVSISGPVSRIKGERFREDLPEQVTNTANVIEINVRNA